MQARKSPTPYKVLRACRECAVDFCFCLFLISLQQVRLQKVLKCERPESLYCSGAENSTSS